MPGEVLVETLEERHMTQAELGRRMARPLKTISEIANGKASITPDTALQLERTLGIPAGVWLRLEADYREQQARERDRGELAVQWEWLREFPVKQLQARGIVKGETVTEQAASLLVYFGVGSPTGWQQHWGDIAGSYRMSESARVSPYAVAAWLRQAELEAAPIELPKYQPSHIASRLPRIRELTRGVVFAGAVEEARALLGGVGVGLILVDGYLGAPASGAVRWIRDNPWIVLTLRYTTDDQFWFSLFHELGHLVSTRRRHDLAEESEGADARHADERAADAFARESLVPQAALDRLLAAGDPDRASIRRMAADLRVAPGVIVGRLQRDGVIRRSQFNDLKARLDRPA